MSQIGELIENADYSILYLLLIELSYEFAQEPTLKADITKLPHPISLHPTLTRILDFYKDRS